MIRLFMGILAIQLISGGFVFAEDLGDVLKGVLGTMAGPREYIFRPGEKIYSKVGEALYYSGFEYTENKKVLLLTYVENGVAITIKYPQPDVIQFKTLRLQIIEFNNSYLKLKEVY